MIHSQLNPNNQTVTLTYGIKYICESNEHTAVFLRGINYSVAVNLFNIPYLLTDIFKSLLILKKISEKIYVYEFLIPLRFTKKDVDFLVAFGRTGNIFNEQKGKPDGCFINYSMTIEVKELQNFFPQKYEILKFVGVNSLFLDAIVDVFVKNLEYMTIGKYYGNIPPSILFRLEASIKYQMIFNPQTFSGKLLKDVNKQIYDGYDRMKFDKCFKTKLYKDCTFIYHDSLDDYQIIDKVRLNNLLLCTKYEQCEVNVINQAIKIMKESMDNQYKQYHQELCPSSPPYY